MEWTVKTARNISFSDLEALQTQCVDSVLKNPEQRFLLLSEPTPTFTYGRFAENQDCLWQKEELSKRGVAVHPVTRGGKWTYHGPGQIVLYPIFKLSELGYSDKAASPYLLRFRETLENTLSPFGFSFQKRNTPFGIYADDKKLASFGVALHGGVSTHGVALYLEDQKKYFEGIVACGVQNEKIGSLRDFGFRLTWEDTALLLATSLKKGLNRRKKGIK